MDLGIDKLSDDQLLDLLKEATAVLGTRDPMIRRMAQATVYDEAEKLKVKKEAIVEAVTKVRKEYVALIHQEAEQDVREKVANGSLQLIPTTEEERLILSANEEARLKLIEELSRPATNGVTNNVSVTINAGQVSLRSGTAVYDTNRAGVADRVRNALRTVLGII